MATYTLFFSDDTESLFDSSFQPLQFNFHISLRSASLWRREYLLNASEPHPAFVLLQPHSETGHLTAVHKNVYLECYRAEDPDKMMLGTELAFSFVYFDLDIFPLLTTARSYFATRTYFTSDLLQTGTGAEDHF